MHPQYLWLQARLQQCVFTAWSAGVFPPLLLRHRESAVQRALGHILPAGHHCSVTLASCWVAVSLTATVAPWYAKSLCLIRSPPCAVSVPDHHPVHGGQRAAGLPLHLPLLPRPLSNQHKDLREVMCATSAWHGSHSTTHNREKRLLRSPGQSPLRSHGCAHAGNAGIA